MNKPKPSSKLGNKTAKNNSTKLAPKKVNKNAKREDKTIDLIELGDSIREVCDNRKTLAKKNRLDSATKKLQGTSGIPDFELTKSCEADLSDGEKEELKYEAEINDVELEDLVKVSKSRSKTSTSEDAKCTGKIDSPKMKKLTLPYDPAVDMFGYRIDPSTKLTYEEAFRNPDYVKKALYLDGESDTCSTPIEPEFTQFVLRKLAVDETDCCSFVKKLDTRAKQYLSKLIGQETSEKYEVHPGNPDEHPNIFRNKFVRLFCQKVITNKQDANYENEKLNKLARIFPFQVSKNVPEYDIDILKKFDNLFYKQMRDFLKKHFDTDVPERETIALFLKNIRHFFETESSSEYLKSFPRLNDKGIYHFQYLYAQYKNVREQFFKNCNRTLPSLVCKKNDFQRIPEKNIEELKLLLRPMEFLAKPKNYAEIFEKYLFFFVHALEVVEGPTPVFFIDDMVYQCLKSLRRFRTLREDPINMVDDIAMMTILNLFGYESEWSNKDGYSINSTTLQNIKDYITTFVTPQNNAQFYQQYKTDLFCELTFRVNNTICFDAGYANKKHKCHRGIMNFYRQLICSVLSPDDQPITDIVCYSAYLGQENRYEIPRDIVESVRNFVRLSTKTNISKVSREPEHNVYLDLLRDRLVVS